MDIENIDEDELFELYNEIGREGNYHTLEENLEKFKEKEDYIVRLYQGKKLLNRLKEKLTNKQRELHRKFSIDISDQNTIKVLINENDFIKIKNYLDETSPVSFYPLGNEFRILGIEIIRTFSVLEEGEVKIVLDVDKMEEK